MASIKNNQESRDNIIMDLIQSEELYVLVKEMALFHFKDDVNYMLNDNEEEVMDELVNEIIDGFEAC